MAVANLNIPPFPKFDLDDHHTISIRWEKYKKRFSNLCTALNITNEPQKLALFLNYAEEELYNVYDSLIVPGAPATDHPYDAAMTLLDNHLNPKGNTTYELYLFRQLKQLIDEPLQTYFIRVKQQVAKCNFTNVENEIKQQMILSTNSNKLGRHAFTNQTLTLQ